MDNRYTIIKDLVLQAIKSLREAGISIDDNDIDNMVNDYNSSEDMTIAQIKQSIIEYERVSLTRKEVMDMLDDPMDVAYNLQSLSVKHRGITLHNQDIDLMMIAISNNYDELNDAMSKITNISMPDSFGEVDFYTYRQKVFDLYLETLSSRNDFILNSDLDLVKKIEYLGRSGVINIDYFHEVQQIIIENKDKGVPAIISLLEEKFDSSKVHEMLLTIRDFSPIEKEGIKGASLENFRNLYEQVRYIYDSITLDEEAKYGKVILQDGTFDDRHLRKALDFAKSMGKTMRINTLFFYMDCPEDIYQLDEGYAATALAKEKLSYYIEETSKILSEYSDVVRSVDVFNELLNRHPLAGEVPYLLRGDILQDGANDNVKAGWLKHLSVEDVCDALVIAREKLPDMDFMYNDDYLTDPEKISATIELVKRIQDYSKGLGVNLIDSIGTQMHIDNDISKEEIRQMFISLSEFGLPIEITEFDLAMTRGLERLTDEQIEFVRQKKINEVYEVIEELKDKCNIRGFTIWSKTDSQNFRVHLANEKLLRNGQDPITSLHGGMLEEDMLPKSCRHSKIIRKQNFNYHTHTNRCGHASDAADEIYVLTAKNSGVTKLGFSDHVPYTSLEYPMPDGRMHISEVDEYIDSIRKLQMDNSDMTIMCGFEAEYSQAKAGFLSDIREKCDYMILGQHYVTDGFRKVPRENNVFYPIKYAEVVCKAMDTGMFDIVAHPDIFMELRDSFSNHEDKSVFMENARKASYMICEKAKELGIPLELNASGLKKGTMSDGEYAYPHTLFWEVAGEVGSLVIYGVDAHYPSQIMRIDEDRKTIDGMIETSKLKLVSNEYDPVVARESNDKLQQLYEETKTNAITYETALVEEIIASSVSGVGESSDIKEQLDISISRMKDRLEKEAENKKKKSSEKIESITNSDSLVYEDKVRLLSQAKLENERISQTITERAAIIDRASQSIFEAQVMGCETKEEYSEVVGYLTETKTQTDPTKIMDASAKLDSFSDNKKNENIGQMTKNTTVSEGKKTKTYTYTSTTSTNSDSGSNNDGGFANSMNLLLAVGVLVLFGIILGLMLV